MTTETCLHLHRLLDPPNGPAIRGVCADCGHVRMYPASPEDVKPKSFNNKSIVARPVEYLAVYGPEPRKSKPKAPKVRAPLKRPEAKVRPVRQQRALTDNQRLTLEYVQARPRSTAPQIAEAFTLDPSTANDRLAALRARGLIERELETFETGFRLYVYSAVSQAPDSAPPPLFVPAVAPAGVT